MIRAGLSGIDGSVGVNMNGIQGKGSEERGVRFVPTTGSVIGGLGKDKTTRTTDAMADLQLGIDGLRSQLPVEYGDQHSLQTEQRDVEDVHRLVHALSAFARTCSVFLRKTVLGDHDRRETRLLDDRVLGSIGLRFDRLRRIPKDERREIQVGFGLRRAHVQLTRLDEHTLKPQETYLLRAGAQEVRLSIQWPLPGAIAALMNHGVCCARYTSFVGIMKKPATVAGTVINMGIRNLAERL